MKTVMHWISRLMGQSPSLTGREGLDGTTERRPPENGIDRQVPERAFEFAVRWSMER